MADQQLFPAIWDGPFDALLPSQKPLARGEECLVTAADLESSHWKPVEKPAKAKAADKPAEEAKS